MHSTAEDRRKHEEMGVIGGWNSSFDCLDEFLAKMVADRRNRLTLTLPSDREIVVTRVFNAPRRLVFEAWTKPEYVKHWFGGCTSMTVTVCESTCAWAAPGAMSCMTPATALTTGSQESTVRLCHRNDWFPPNATNRFPDSDHLNTLTLTEQDGKTTLHIHIQYPSVEQRDGHLHSGMEMGMRRDPEPPRRTPRINGIKMN
jgi:uncharacterized protein YndB with AHSA1/START domain